jgi:hypothetical protein
MAVNSTANKVAALQHGCNSREELTSCIYLEDISACSVIQASPNDVVVVVLRQEEYLCIRDEVAQTLLSLDAIQTREADVEQRQVRLQLRCISQILSIRYQQGRCTIRFRLMPLAGSPTGARRCILRHSCWFQLKYVWTSSATRNNAVVSAGQISPPEPELPKATWNRPSISNMMAARRFWSADEAARLSMATMCQ